MTDPVFVPPGPATTRPPALRAAADMPMNPARTPPVISTARAAWALALLLGLQPVTTDLYLPTLPALTRALAAPMPLAQLTMSALILAFGVAQLFWGPAADRVGRRPVLLCGLFLFTLASIGGALAGTVEMLIVWRALQGAAMAAAVVCARAIVRDLYEPREGAQVMSLGLSGLAVIAIFSPILGGLIGALAGDATSWRIALGAVAGAGALSLAFVAWRLPETLTQLNPQTTRWWPLLQQWQRIASHREFVAWAGLVTCSYGGLFVILAGSSFVYIDALGLSPGLYGLAMASNSCSYLLGTWVCRRWIVRYGVRGAVARGAAFTLAGALGMVGVALSTAPALAALLLAQWLYLFGHGIHQPCGQAAAVGPFPRHAGAASALAGFLLAGVAFGTGLWLGRALGSSVQPYTWGVAFWGAATTAVAWTLVPRSGR